MYEIDLFGSSKAPRIAIALSGIISANGSVAAFIANAGVPFALHWRCL